MQKEGLMERQKQARIREFAVTVKFEATRLELQNLNAAYELVLPVSEGSGNKATKTRTSRASVNQLEKQMQIIQPTVAAIS